jgi:acyl-CoA thioesterase-2
VIKDDSVNQSLDDILKLLKLERLEVNLFRGQSPNEQRQRVFGGQVLGQALSAANYTVEGMDCHSFHSYFLRPGDPNTPIIYEVDTARDGRSFASRRVIAIQHGKQIFNMSASFQRPEEGREHQIAMPDAPDPESLASDYELRAKIADKVPPEWRESFLRRRPFEMRPIEPKNMFKPTKLEPRHMVWFKADPGMPDDLPSNQAMLAYMSDTTLLDTSLRPHALTYLNPKLQSASLDHAMWFYHTFRADEWILYVQDSPASAGGRGMNFGHFFTQDGKLICSTAQEGLIRVRD